MWYKNVGATVFRFVTNHAFDRRTGRTDSFIVARPCMQSGYKTAQFIAEIAKKTSTTAN